MKNMNMKIEGDELVIRVNLKEDHGLSKSGKTIIIASSEGNISLPGDPLVKIGLNIYRTR